MTTLVMLSILVFGLSAYRVLPVSDLPNVDFPTISVTANLPGASPETMASAVATPLEKQFSTIAGLDSMTSTNALGNTQITLQFNLSRDIDAAAQDEPEPLWAYAFSAPPKPGDKAIPQAPATRNLRPNENAEEQTRPRRVDGSSAAYSLVEIRDGHDVIDWFPGDHPPMTDIIRHGPASLMAERGRGCGSCHLPNGKGRPENAPPAGQPVPAVETRPVSEPV